MTLIVCVKSIKFQSHSYTQHPLETIRRTEADIRTDRCGRALRSRHNL
uniref:Uncharacterized protein n=1 Tax=Parascaris univalens TaxID=6257 RepID=A0A915A6T0_PARUN